MLPDNFFLLQDTWPRVGSHGTPHVPGVPWRGRQRDIREVSGAAVVCPQGDNGAGVRRDGEIQDVFVGDRQLGAHAGHAAHGDVIATI